MVRAEPHTRRASRGVSSEAFIGIDTAKLRNAVAIAETGGRGELSRRGGDRRGFHAQAGRRAGKQVSQADILPRSGPDGYGLHGLIESLGHTCIVVAPSQTLRGRSTRSMPASRPRQPRTYKRTCGIEPANQSLITDVFGSRPHPRTIHRTAARRIAQCDVANARAQCLTWDTALPGHYLG